MTRLFVSFYDEKNERRKSELKQCLLNNILCKEIDEIFVLVEVAENQTALDVDLPIDDNKIHYVYVYKRPTFKDFFETINRTLINENQISIIANSDIFFDETLELAKGIQQNECYALSRWEINEDGSNGELVQKFGDSADAWVVKGTVEPIEYSDIQLGKLGVDNRIAHEFKQAGYSVTNPCLSVKIWHLHNSGIRNYDPLIDRKNGNFIPPPYYIVKPCELNY